MLTILSSIFFLLVLIFLSSIYCCSLLSHTGAHFSLFYYSVNFYFFYWCSFLSSTGALFYWCSLLCLPTGAHYYLLYWCWRLSSTCAHFSVFLLVLTTLSSTGAHFSLFLMIRIALSSYQCLRLSLPADFYFSFFLFTYADFSPVLLMFFVFITSYCSSSLSHLIIFEILLLFLHLDLSFFSYSNFSYFHKINNLSTISFY